MQLRPYQEQAVKAVFDTWNNGSRGALVEMPTGTGKTVVFSEIARRSGIAPENVLVIANRDKLVTQAMGTMEAAGIPVQPAPKPRKDLLPGSATVATAQAMSRPARLESIDPSRYDLIIIDEAHHVAADTYGRIIDRFGKARLLGVTATPERSDKKDISDVLGKPAYRYGMPQALEDGAICPVEARLIPLGIDIRNVSVKRGDYDGRQLGHAIEPYLERIADSIAEHAEGRRTVVFLPLVSLAERMAGLLSARGLRAREIDGGTKDPDSVTAAFGRGEYDALCNAMLLAEGWDCPSVDCVVPLRPTRSPSFYRQMAGRGTRPCDGKDGLLILDYMWLEERHGLCRPSCVATDDADEAARIDEAMRSGRTVGLLREKRSGKAIAAAIDRHAGRKERSVDPIRGGTYRPVTDGQRTCLYQLRAEDADVWTYDQARALIDALVSQGRKRGPTKRMAECLMRGGFTGVRYWTYWQANRVIDYLSKHRWTLPAGMDPATFRPAAHPEITRFAG